MPQLPLPPLQPPENDHQYDIPLGCLTGVGLAAGSWFLALLITGLFGFGRLGDRVFPLSWALCFALLAFITVRAFRRNGYSTAGIVIAIAAFILIDGICWRIVH